MKRVLIVLIAGLFLVLANGTGASASQVGGPPAGLTSSGRVLWNFEALLRQTFGSHYKGCLRTLSRYVETFTTDNYCATHDAAQTMYYSFAFANQSASAYHLVERTFAPGAFGNYPEPIRVEKNYVTCDPAGRTYLISYGDVFGLSANLACIKPNP